MRTKNSYHIAGKISLGLILLGGVLALTVPAIRKKTWYVGSPSPLLVKEHNIVLENPAVEEVSIVQTRCHPGI